MLLHTLCHHSMFSYILSSFTPYVYRTLMVYPPSPLCISCINGVPHAYKHVHTVLGFTWGYSLQELISSDSLWACISLSPGAWSPSLEKPAILASTCTSSRSGPIICGGFYTETIPGIWFLLQGHVSVNSILLTLQMGHLDGLMTNQPMITHNCGVMHLVFFNFRGGTCYDSAMTVKVSSQSNQL